MKDFKRSRPYLQGGKNSKGTFEGLPRFSDTKIGLMVLLVLGFLSINAFAAGVSALVLPKPTGIYGVGRISFELTDPQRLELLSSVQNTHRRFVVRVWYPVDDKAEATQATAPYLPDFDAVRPKLSNGDIVDLFRPAVYSGPQSLPKTDVFENASIVPGKQKFPLLLFSPGWGNPSFLYTAEISDLVSHGYIVASIDHPYDTLYTQFSNGDIVFFAQDRFDKEVAKQPHGLSNYAKERVEVMALDSQLALKELLNPTDSRFRFSGRIDDKNIGSLGHSIGGLTAARICQLEKRIKACIDQDSTDYRGSPFVASALGEAEKQPLLLFVVSSADVWSPKALTISDDELARQKRTRAAFMASMKEQQDNQTAELTAIPGGAYRVRLYDLPGFTHRSFSDLPLIAASLDHDQSLLNFKIAQMYTLAFFDKYLKKKTSSFLDSGALDDGRVIVERFKKH